MKRLAAPASIAGLLLLGLASHLWAGSHEPTELDAASVQVFVDDWYRKQNNFVANRWLGVQTLQNPLDAWVTQEIISEVRPDLIVETGTYRGGSALMWAGILEAITPDARVVTIDVENRTKKARQHPLWQRRVLFLKGSSTAPEIVARVRQEARGKHVLVILDSLHTREHVLKELELYAPLVPVGGYVVVQDTGAGSPKFGNVSGAALAVVDFLAATDGFERDRSRERFVLTNNPGGFLKRVK